MKFFLLLCAFGVLASVDAKCPSTLPTGYDNWQGAAAVFFTFLPRCITLPIVRLRQTSSGNYITSCELSTGCINIACPCLGITAMFTFQSAISAPGLTNTALGDCKYTLGDTSDMNRYTYTNMVTGVKEPAYMVAGYLNKYGIVAKCSPEPTATTLYDLSIAYGVLDDDTVDAINDYVHANTGGNLPNFDINTTCKGTPA